ncbi:MAG: hypothetical protein ACO4CU_03475 [Ilumatobacteraceae bacterium]
MAIPLFDEIEVRPDVRRSVHGDRRPDLHVVAGPRRTTRVLIVTMFLLGALLVGLLVFHTRIAERQLRIDDLDRAVRQAQVDFDVLRAERAELRSPTRLSVRGGELGMVPGSESDFVSAEPTALAVLIATTGEVPVAEVIGAGANTRLEPLDQFRLVKAAGTEAP